MSPRDVKYVFESPRKGRLPERGIETFSEGIEVAAVEDGQKCFHRVETVAGLDRGRCDVGEASTDLLNTPIRANQAAHLGETRRVIWRAE
jgi:hypothetical protein